MAGKNIKTTITVTFIALLALAMLVQSLVVMFLGVRHVMTREVKKIQDHQQSMARFIEYLYKNTIENQTFAEEIFDSGKDNDLCTYVYFPDKLTVAEPLCKFSYSAREVAKKAHNNNQMETEFVGMEWSFLSFRHEAVIVAVPLFDKDGRCFGVLVAEDSFAPIFQGQTRDAKIALFYLVLNTIIFATLGFFRLARTVFRPIDRVVQLAESYIPENQMLFPVEENQGAFYTLTKSLNSMLAKIELDNRKLRDTIAELARLNKELQENKNHVVRSEKLAAVGRLSAGLAHEIGNPLAIVQGYLDLLRRIDLTQEERNQFSEKSQLELERIKNLIRQLLDFARPACVPLQLVHINDVVRDVIEFIKMEKSFANCQITPWLQDGRDAIMADANTIRQVLINCLFNAADALESVEGVREIHLVTYNEKNEVGDDVLCLVMRDNGCGIAKDNLDKIFEPFFTTKEPGKGTGLGLFVCHTIIDRLGGTITIANLPGGGAEMKIILPVANSL